MSDHPNAASQGMPPHAQLIQMGTGSWMSGIVYAVARLGLADHLADGPRCAAEISGALRVHAPSLHRRIRATLIAFCGPWFSAGWAQILYSLETGQTGFERAFGMNAFKYLAQHPDEASYFSAQSQNILRSWPRPAFE